MNLRTIWGMALLILAITLGVWALRGFGNGGDRATGTGGGAQGGQPGLKGAASPDLMCADGTGAGADAKRDSTSGDESARLVLVVRVLDDANEPVSDVSVVVVSHAAGGGDQAAASAETDADGIARMAVARTHYPLDLVVLDDGWRVGARSLDAPEKEVDITIGSAHTCRITVRDHLDAPVEGALVLFCQSTQQASGSGDLPARSQSTDAQGVAVLQGRVRWSMMGDLEVRPSEASGEFEKVTEKLWIPVERADVVVVRWARITGRVLFKGGQVAPSASVSWRSGEEGNFLIQTDAQGRFSIRSRSGVSVQISARAGAALSVDWLSPDVRRVVAPAEGVVLEVERGDRLRVDVDGMREGVSVQCFLIREPDRIEQSLRVKSGMCEFVGLAPDAVFSIWICSNAGDYAHARGVAGSAGSIRLTLQRGRRLEFELVPPDGWLAGDVSLFDRGVHLRAKRLSRHRFLLEGLPPGDFRVHVFLLSKQDSRDVELTTDEIAAAEGPIELSLDDAEKDGK